MTKSEVARLLWKVGALKAVRCDNCIYWRPLNERIGVCVRPPEDEWFTTKAGLFCTEGRVRGTRMDEAEE